MSKLPLLVDSWNFVPSALEEGKDSGGRMIVRGEFARAGVPTENNRIYPKQLWEREIKRLAKAMSERKIYGTIDHPANGRTSLKDCSHLVTKLWLEGDILMGEAELLNTVAGRDIQAILEVTGHLGVSSRGFGTTRPNQEGKDVVQDDYRFLTVDFVADPANTTSYPTVQSEDKKRPTENKVMEDKLTLDGLRKSNPTLFENLRDEFEREYDKRGAKIWAAKIEAAKTDASADMKSVFAENLKAAIEAAAAEVAAVEREKLMNDPTVAGAKSTLEGLKAMLRPYIVPEDVEAVVKSKEVELSTINQKLAAAELKIANLANENTQLAAVAKEAGYKYHLESLLAGNPHAAVIRKGVGDVKKFESVQDLDTRVSELADELKKVQVKQEERDTEVERLKTENKLLQVAAEKAIEATKLMGVMSYAEERLRNHPKAGEVRLVLEAQEPETKEAVDAVLSKFREKKVDQQTLAEARARVRALVGSDTKEYINEDVDTSLNKVSKPAAVDYNGLGASADTLRALSGMGSE